MWFHRRENKTAERIRGNVMKYLIEMDEEDVSVHLAGLGELKYKTAAKRVARLVDQVRAQRAAAEKAAAEPPAATTPPPLQIVKE